MTQTCKIVLRQNYYFISVRPSYFILFPPMCYFRSYLKMTSTSAPQMSADCIGNERDRSVRVSRQTEETRSLTILIILRPSSANYPVSGREQQN